MPNMDKIREDQSKWLDKREDTIARRQAELEADPRYVDLSVARDAANAASLLRRAHTASQQNTLNPALRARSSGNNYAQATNYGLDTLYRRTQETRGQAQADAVQQYMRRSQEVAQRNQPDWEPRAPYGEAPSRRYSHILSALEQMQADRSESGIGQLDTDAFARLRQQGRYSGRVVDLTDYNSAIREMAMYPDQIQQEDVERMRAELQQYVTPELEGTQEYTAASQYLRMLDELGSGGALGYAAYTAQRLAQGSLGTINNFANGLEAPVMDFLSNGTYSDGYQKLENYFNGAYGTPINRAQMEASPSRDVLRTEVANQLGIDKRVVDAYLASTRNEMINQVTEPFYTNVSQGYQNTVGNMAYMLGDQLTRMALGAAVPTGSSGSGGIIQEVMDGTSMRQSLSNALQNALSGNMTTYLSGASAALNAYAETARNNGYDPLNYVNALSQGAIEYFTEGLFGISDAQSVSALFNTARGSTGRTIASAIMNWLITGTEEGLEEVVNVPLSGIAESLTTDPDKPISGPGGIFDWDAMIENGVSGAIMGLLLGGVGGIAGTQQMLSESGDIRAAGERLNRINQNLPQAYRLSPMSVDSATVDSVNSYSAELLQAYNRLQTDEMNANQEADSSFNIVLPRAGESGVLPTAADLERMEADLLQRRSPAIAQSGREAGATSRDIQTAQRLSDALGRDVRFYRGDRSENGYYAGNTIYINTQSANTVSQIIAHELTHSIEQAGNYGNLSRLVLSRIQQQGGNLEQLRQAKRELYARNGHALENDAAVDQELVAEYVEQNLLTNEAEIQSLVQQNRSLGQRIHDWIDSVLAKLGNSNAQERQFLTRARELYARALRQTGQQRPARTGVQQVMNNLGSAQQVNAQAILNPLSSPQTATGAQNIVTESTDISLELSPEAEIQRRTDVQSLLDQLDAGEITEAQLETAVAELFSNTEAPSSADARYSIDENYERDIEDWDRRGRPDGEVFVLGSTGDVLQGLGAMEQDIYLRSEKVNRILEQHPEMTLTEIERIPEILDDPVLVLKSLGAWARTENTRLVLFGTVRAENGQPVLAVLDLRPVENGLAIDDMQKVNSAYTKDRGVANFVQRSEVMYADEKRTTPLLRSIGLTIASRPLLRSGSMGSITYGSNSVNIEGVPFDQVVRTGQVGDSNAQYSLSDTDRQQFIQLLRAYARGESGAEAVQRYLDQVEQYGAIQQGERPARAVEVPVSTDGTDRVSRAARTVMESRTTPDNMLGDVAEAIANGQLSHQVNTDDAAMGRARRTVENKGWDGALEEFHQAAKRGRLSKDHVALGQVLLNNAMNAGDSRTAISILVDYASMATAAGQTLQAQRMLKRLTPEGQLYGIQRSATSIEEDLRRQYGDRAPDLHIREDLAQQFMEAQSQEQRDAVAQEIYKDLAKQVPSTLMDKWNAWRYMAMLTNPRTHIRNIVGNAGFAPVRMIKNAIGAAMEGGLDLVLPDGLQTRTKAFLNFASKSDRALVRQAFADVANVENQLLGSGKYSDSPRGQIEENRQIFKFRPLEAVRRANSAAMEIEDAWFSKTAYAGALAGYMKANDISAEALANGTVDPELLDAARSYAIEEAQKATYRDANAFSDFISKLRYRGSNPVGRAANVLIEGVLPFRRTPANILVRGVEYSPVGLVKGLTYDLVQVARGNMTGAEAIDDIAAGLTGSGLVALGAWLASMGLITGGGSGDDDQDAQNDLTGGQNYAISIGGKNYTLDWLAPEALPFFVGVELFNVLSEDSEDGVNFSDITDAAERIMDPMLEMSMLQGVQDAIDTVRFADGGTLLKVAANAVVSYFSQAVPTLFGQIERTTETQRESTFVDRDSGIPSDLQYTFGRTMNKLPGEYQQIPYVDAWGRTEETGSTLERALNNFLNPSYVSTENVTAADEELQRLYDAGQTGVFPSRVQQSQEVDGVRMSADEYVEYATIKGQTSYDLVSEMIQSDFYQGLTDEQKADAINQAYKYAGHIAAEAIHPDHESESYVANAKAAEADLGLSEAEYLMMYSQYGSGNMERYGKALDAGVDEAAAQKLVFELDYNMDQIERYQEFVMSGVDDATAELLTEELDALEPIGDAESVSALQKYWTIVEAPLSDEDQISVLSKEMEESAYEKLEYVYENYGVRPRSYVEFLDAVPRYDADGNGSIKQSELTAAVDSLPGLSNEERAALWQSYNKGWSYKNNPYSTSVGQAVRNALNPD